MCLIALRVVCNVLSVHGVKTSDPVHPDSIPTPYRSVEYQANRIRYAHPSSPRCTLHRLQSHNGLCTQFNFHVTYRFTLGFGFRAQAGQAAECVQVQKLFFFLAADNLNCILFFARIFPSAFYCQFLGRYLQCHQRQQ